MPGKVLLIPVFLLFILLTLYGLWVGEISLYIVIPFLVLAVGLYIFQYKVNELWYYKHPPDLNIYEKKWCQDFLPYYPKDSDEAQRTFNQELARELRLKEFILMGLDNIPEHIKLYCLAPAIELGLSKEADFIKHYNRIVIYPHPFITPNIEMVHICETHDEDGVLILSLEQLNGSLIQPELYPNPAAYLWAKLYVQKFKLKSELSEEQKWSMITEMLHLEKEYIINYFGLHDIDTEALLLSIQKLK